MHQRMEKIVLKKSILKLVKLQYFNTVYIALKTNRIMAADENTRTLNKGNYDFLICNLGKRDAHFAEFLF